jgi:hypothetical protein
MTKTPYKRQWNTHFVREKRKKLTDSEREAMNARRREKYREQTEQKRKSRQATALLQLKKRHGTAIKRLKRVQKTTEIAEAAAIITAIKTTQVESQSIQIRSRYPARNTRKPQCYNEEPAVSYDYDKYIGWYAVAQNSIMSDTIIGEYNGQRINFIEMKRSVTELGSNKIMQLDENTYIDGLYSNSFGGYMTHACNHVANCIVMPLRGKLIIKSQKSIGKGDKITIDYGFNPGNDKNHRWLRRYRCPVCNRHSAIADGNN